jgi:hypothetical protein
VSLLGRFCGGYGLWNGGTLMIFERYFFPWIELFVLADLMVDDFDMRSIGLEKNIGGYLFWTNNNKIKTKCFIRVN